MIEIGSKVYAYENGNAYVSKITNEEVIGEIVEITQSGYTIIHSIIDDQMYMIKSENVYEVGTGPIVKSKVVYEDYYV